MSTGGRAETPQRHCFANLAGRSARGLLFQASVWVSGQSSPSLACPTLERTRAGAATALRWRTCPWHATRHYFFVSFRCRDWDRYFYGLGRMCYRTFSLLPSLPLRLSWSQRSWARLLAQEHQSPWLRRLCQAMCQTSCSTGLLGWRNSCACCQPD